MRASSLSQKLWFLVTALLIACATVGALIQWRSSTVNRDAQAQSRAAEHLITLVTHWRALTQLNTERVLASNLSPNPLMMRFLVERLKPGVVASDALEKEITELATGARNKLAVEKAAQLRGQVLTGVKQAQALNGADRRTGEFGLRAARWQLAGQSGDRPDRPDDAAERGAGRRGRCGVHLDERTGATTDADGGAFPDRRQGALTAGRFFAESLLFQNLEFRNVAAVTATTLVKTLTRLIK